MFEKIRKKAGSLRKAGKGREERRCVLCMRELKEMMDIGWIEILRGNDEHAYICTDCAWKTYETVDRIMETYENLAVAAADETDGVLGTGENGENREAGVDSTDGADGNTPESTGDKKVGCTPQSAYACLSSRVVGQEHAKKVIAVAVYNHWKRMEMKEEGNGGPSIEKSNILLIGPTGTGKTLLAEAAADILDVPFVSINATALTEAGYKGEDVESAVEKLVQAADGDVGRAEHGIIYIDEIDKLSASGREVGAKGVQQSLLKLIEGTIVTLESPFSPSGMMAGLDEQYEVDTSGILFICGGSFVGLQEEIKKREGKAAIGFRAGMADGEGKAALRKNAGACGVTNKDLEKYGIIPELAGRLPVKAVLDPLGKEELARILTEPENAIIKQYQAMLAADSVEFSCTKEALERIAEYALEEKAGARGLRAILEGVMLETMFRAPGGRGHASLVLTADDIDGITRPEDRLVWDGAEEKTEGTASAGSADTEKKEDKKPEAGKPSGGIRKEVKNNGKFCTTA